MGFTTEISRQVSAIYDRRKLITVWRGGGGVVLEPPPSDTNIQLERNASDRKPACWKARGGGLLTGCDRESPRASDHTAIGLMGIPLAEATAGTPTDITSFPLPLSGKKHTHQLFYRNRHADHGVKRAALTKKSDNRTR